MKELTDDERRQRAAQAKMWLDDPLFNEMFETTRAAYLSGLFSCSEKDDLGRFRITEAMKVVDTVKAHLAVVAQGADPDVSELEEKKRLPRIF